MVWPVIKLIYEGISQSTEETTVALNAVDNFISALEAATPPNDKSEKQLTRFSQNLQPSINLSPSMK